MNTWSKPIQKEPSGARLMLSGPPGRFSTKISVFPFLFPFSQNFRHLNLIQKQAICWNIFFFHVLQESGKWKLLTSKFHRRPENLLLLREQHHWGSTNHRAELRSHSMRDHTWAIAHEAWPPEHLDTNHGVQIWCLEH